MIENLPLKPNGKLELVVIGLLGFIFVFKI